MNCSTDIKTHEEVVYCHICDRELDLITAAISQDQMDSIYICFGTIKQKIFVYGKYSSGQYGTPSLSGQYTKAECESKACEKDITDFLEGRNETEYSRLIDCHRGKMECSILTRGACGKEKAGASGWQARKLLPRLYTETEIFLPARRGRNELHMHMR